MYDKSMECTSKWNGIQVDNCFSQTCFRDVLLNSHALDYENKKVHKKYLCFDVLHVHVLKGGFWLLSTSGIKYFYHVPQWVRIIRV